MISFKTLNGEDIFINNINENDTIKDIKIKICDTLCYDYDIDNKNFKLIYNSITLSNNTIFRDIFYQNDKIIYVILPPKNLMIASEPFQSTNIEKILTNSKKTIEKPIQEENLRILKKILIELRDIKSLIISGNISVKVI